MIIQCTHCKARFKISDSKAKKDEIKARCAKCEQIFVARIGVNAFVGDEVSSSGVKAKSEPAPQRNQPQIPLIDKQGSIFEEVPDDRPLFDDGELGLKPAREKPEVSSLKDIVLEEDLSESEPGLPDPDTQQKMDPSAEELSREIVRQEEKKEGEYLISSSSETQAIEGLSEKEDSNGVAVAKIKLKKVSVTGAGKTRVRRKEQNLPRYLFFLYPVVIIAALLMGLLLAGIPFPFKNISLLFAKVPGANSRSINIYRISSDYLNSISGSDILLISGEIYNNSMQDIKKITLEAELYKANNRFIIKGKFPCCLEFSKTSVYEISNREAIDAMYKEELLQVPPPGQSRPFTLIFEKPEEEMESFRINISNE